MRKCQGCGGPILSKKKGRKFCSRQCYGVSRRTVPADAAAAASNDGDEIERRRAHFARVRDWRERFDANAPMVWARSLFFDGKQVEPGDPVDKEMIGRGKLVVFWKARAIRLDEAVPA